MSYELLTVNQTKMLKSVSENYLSAVLHLEPAYQIGRLNTCPNAGICKGTCIAKTGRMRFDNARQARIRRTELFYYDPYYFFKLLDAEIHSVQWKARRQRMQLSVRLNGTSDIPYETYLDSSGLNVFQRHPDIQFLDYTKIEDRMTLQIPNYTLVYSVSERSDPAVVTGMLDRGARVATVFSTKRGEELPKRYSFAGKSYRVVDGDTHDLLHLRPQGTILGLRYKMAFSERTRKALRPNKRFVILQEQT